MTQKQFDQLRSLLDKTDKFGCAEEKLLIKKIRDILDLHNVLCGQCGKSTGQLDGEVDTCDIETCSKPLCKECKVRSNRFSFYPVIICPSCAERKFKKKG